ncbi:hypothetical protein JXA84_09065 [candidate division WOR-3 bacterium]|nr:hypothetical protein [candidate division WOR-3 bacterium]
MNFRQSKTFLRELHDNENSVQKYFEPDLFGLKKAVPLFDTRGMIKVKIVGTNGKGSVVSMLVYALRECGLKTVSFSSPHLVDELERICIDGEKVSHEKFSSALSEVILRFDKKFTYFETMLLTCLAISVSEKPDVLILEAGMGGRYDATNAVQCGIVACTSISLDHVEFLGHTENQIALDKAGGFSGPCDVVVSFEGTKFDIFRIRAHINGAKIHRADELIGFKSGFSLEGGTGCRTDEFGTATTLLKGDYQIENLKLALSILKLLKKDFDIENCLVVSGLMNARHKGRLQYISQKPLKIIDGSHNVQGVRETVRFLEKTHRVKFKVYFSSMKDKDYFGMIQELDNIALCFVITGTGGERNLGANEMEEVFKAIPKEHIYTDKVEFIRNFLKDRSDSIAIGSLKTAGDILKALT